MSVHDAARKFVCDALDDEARKQLLAGQEFLATKLEKLAEEMEGEFESLRDDLGKDLKSVIEAMGRQKGR